MRARSRYLGSGPARSHLPRPCLTGLISLCLALAFWSASTLLAQPALVTTPPTAEPAPDSLDPELAPAHQYFTDIELVDQNGRPQRLYSDLLAGKIVVINAFFTSCQGVCPVMAGNLTRVQSWLGDRLGRDVFLLSFSVDPETDTPARLLDYAQRFGARSGWSFLTGSSSNVDQALHKLGHRVDNPENHTSVMIIGNVPTGLWKKVQGLSPANEIIRVLQTVLEDEVGAAGAASDLPRGEQGDR